MDGWVQLVASTQVLDETRRDLARTSPGAVAFFEMFLKPEILESINPASSLVQHVAHQVEPKDAAIIAGAIASECPAIATFDRRHLLAEAESIHREWAIRVEMPGDILQRLSLLRGEE
jgi:predicted nucleic acid-binding protein